jgi:hypothetical protein
MSRRSRVRGVLRWGGTALCLLLLAAFAVSVFRIAGYTTGGDRSVEDWDFDCYLAQGTLVFYYCRWKPEAFQLPDGRRMRLTVQGGWASRRPSSEVLTGRPRFFWWDDQPKERFGHVKLIVPLWIPFLLLLIPTTYLWYRDRRTISPGHCRRCGYNLTGNESGRCPECGTQVPNECPATQRV